MTVVSDHRQRQFKYVYTEASGGHASARSFRVVGHTPKRLAAASRSELNAVAATQREITKVLVTMSRIHGSLSSYYSQRFGFWIYIFESLLRGESAAVSTADSSQSRQLDLGV